jgi:hypothetical protein
VRVEGVGGKYRGQETGGGGNEMEIFKLHKKISDLVNGASCFVPTEVLSNYFFFFTILSH